LREVQWPLAQFQLSPMPSVSATFDPNGQLKALH
jgi:hypothetical protein